MQNKNRYRYILVVLPDESLFRVSNMAKENSDNFIMRPSLLRQEANSSEKRESITEKVWNLEILEIADCFWKVWVRSWTFAFRFD